LPDMSAPADVVTIGARTEHLRIVKAQKAAAHGRVTWIEHLGDQNHLHIRIDQHEVVTLVDLDAALAVGDDVGVSLVRPLFFDAAGTRLAI
jgi:multiple sugar transport system ATP-binding protein